MRVDTHIRSALVMILAAASLALATPGALSGSEEAPKAAATDTSNLNSIHGISEDFIVGVGDHGVIIHFDTDGPRRVSSGTTNRLLDVYVTAPDFAVAAGMGIVLLWNGEQWSPIVTGPADAAYHGAWASPEKDVVLYGSRQGGFELVCPYLPGRENQPFCRRFEARFIGACGHSDAVNLVLANGDIHRVNNAILDSEGRFAPIFRQSIPLELTAAWFPDPHCGVRRAPEVIAVNGGRQMWRFDGRGWGLVSEALAQSTALKDPASRKNAQ